MTQVTKQQITDYLRVQNDVSPTFVRPANHKIISFLNNVATFDKMITALTADIKAGEANAIITRDDFVATYTSVVMTMGDVGTKTDGELPSTEFTCTYHKAAADANAAQTTYTFAIGLQPHLTGANSYRRFARGNCVAAVKFAREYNYAYAVGLEHGVPPDLSYLGFDFADVYKPANSREAAAIRQAKTAGLYRETTGDRQFTNVSTRMHPEAADTYGS